MPRRYGGVLALLVVAGLALPATAVVQTWYDVSGTQLAGRNVIAIAARVAGPEEVAIAATDDGALWRWNAAISEWDIIGTLGGSPWRLLLVPDPLYPDSVFMSFVIGEGEVMAIRRGGWLQSADDWTSLAADAYVSCIARVPGSDTLLAASANVIRRSTDAGWTWEPADTLACYGDITKLVVVPGAAGNLIVAVRSDVANPGWTNAVGLASGDGEWKALTDSAYIGSVYDLIYDSVGGMVFLAGEQHLFRVSAAELAAQYATGSYVDIVPTKDLASGEPIYMYPRALAMDGSDLVVLTDGGGACRILDHGRGIYVDAGEGLPWAIPTRLVAGATKLFAACRNYEGYSTAGVFATALTGGTPTTSISGRVEINGARPPVGSLVAVWSGSPVNHGDMSIVAQGVTDSLGNYVVGGVSPGEYMVAFLGPEGRIPTIGDAGIPPGPFSNAQLVPVDGINPVSDIDLVFDGAPEWGVGRGEFQSLAIPIAPGRTVESTIDAPGWIDYDWYYVPLDSGQAVIVDVNPTRTSLFSPGVEFFDADGSSLGMYGYYGVTMAHIGATAPDSRGLWFRIFNYDSWDKPADGGFLYGYTMTVTSAPSAIGDHSAPENAVALAKGQPMVGWLNHVYARNDLYRITVEEGSALWIEVNHTSIYNTPQVRLLDENGFGYEGQTSVSTSQSGTWRLDALVDPGTYYVELSAYQETAQYVVVWGTEATEPNDDPDTATSIAYGQTLTGMNIASTNDWDAYHFYGSAGDVISATVTPHDAEGEHPALELYGADETFYRRGVMQDASDDGLPDGKVRLLATLPTSGDYWLVVSPDYNWYHYQPMQGAQALYDISLELLNADVAAAANPEDLFLEPYAKVFAPAVARGEDGTTHYAWLGESGGAKVARGVSSTYYDGMISYARADAEGTLLTGPSMLAPSFLYSGGQPTKPAAAAATTKSAVNENGGARPAIALDSQGRVHIVWLSMLYDYYSGVYASNLCHLSFDPSKAPNNGEPIEDLAAAGGTMTIPIVDNIDDQPDGDDGGSWGESAVRMIIGSDDVIHLVWDQEYCIRYARLTPEGNLIGEPVTLATLRDGYNKCPDAAMDAAGRIHIAWARSATTVVYAVIDGEGQVLLPPTSIGGDAAWVGIPTIAIDPQGVVHVAWTGGTEPSDWASIRHGEVLYARIDPGRAPLDGSPVSGVTLLTVPPRVVTPNDDWPSIQPKLTVGGDGDVYLSWHEWGQATSEQMNKAAHGYSDYRNSYGPDVLGLEMARIGPEGGLLGAPTVADANVMWVNWASDPSPVIVDASGMAHLAWASAERAIDFGGWTAWGNTLATQAIEVGGPSEQTVSLVGYKPHLLQLNRAVAGDTIRFAVLAKNLSGPLSTAQVFIEFDPAVLSADPSWSLVSSALPVTVFNIEGDTLEIAAMSTEGEEVSLPSDTLFVVKMAVQPDVPLLTQSPLIFVNDVARSRRTLLDEGRPTAMGAILTIGIIGDVSGDGTIAAMDASIVLRSVVGLATVGTYPALIPALADASGYSGVTAYDAALILRHVVGRLDHFPAEGFGGTPRPVAAGSYVAGFGAPRMDRDLFVLPISVDDRAGVEAGLVRFTMPAALGTIASIRTVGANGIASYRQDGDFVVVAFADPSAGAPGAGDILEIAIRATGADLGQEIRLTEVALNEGANVTLDGAETNLLSALPRSASIGPNAPNPFNPTTTIPYAVPYVPGQAIAPVPTNLAIYNLAGQVVATLVDAPMMPGVHTAAWDGLDHAGRQVGAGIYLAVLRCGSQMRTTRMVLVR